MLALAPRNPVVAIVDGAVGLGLIMWGLSAAIKGARTRKWLCTRGVITVSRLEPSSRDQWGFRYYNVLISYRFSVAGTSREGYQVSVGAPGINLPAQAAQSLVDRYAPGTPVEVYYDPLDPSHTVLEPGIGGDIGAGIIIGVGVLGLGAWLFLHGL